MNPSSGRFASMDSYEGSSDDPGSLHKYIYAAGNAPNRTDPLGNESIAEQAGVAVALGTLAAITVLYAVKVANEITISITLRPHFPFPQPSPSPSPLPSPRPVPVPTPDEPSQRYVNLDASTAVGIAMEASPSGEAIFRELRGRQMLMCSTAIEEFRQDMIAAGVKERRRGELLLHMVTPIADTPDADMMRVPDPNGSRVNDKIIFGTGQSWNVQTFTGDARFVAHAESNGIIWRPVRPFIHAPARFRNE